MFFLKECKSYAYLTEKLTSLSGIVKNRF